MDPIVSDVEWSEVFIQKAMRGDEMTGFRSIGARSSPFLDRMVPEEEIKPNWCLETDVARAPVRVKQERRSSFDRLGGNRVYTQNTSHPVIW